MKNCIFIICFSFLFTLQFNGQCVVEPIVYLQENPLENKHRSSRIYAPGYISGDIQNSESYSAVEEQLLFNVGYFKSLWVSGFAPDGTLRFTGLDYLLNPAEGMVAGPISGSDNEAFCDFYSNIWLVSGQEITYLKSKFENGDLRVDDVPEDIMTWPAKNNPHIGEFAVDYDMAPFFDFNSDDIYNPLDGDYPLAVQQQVNLIPLAFNFSIYSNNVNFEDHSGPAVDIEVHQVNFVFDCPNLTEANNSVFTNVNVIYKGSENLTGVRVGLWEDSDLGCYENDYNGCSPDLDAIFTYNINAFGESLCPQNIAGLTQPGAAFQTFVFLNADILSYLVYNNPAVGNNPGQTSDPETLNEYYNYLNGVWRDGTPMTKGGTGFNPGSNDQTKFLYEDLPNNPNGWSMESQALGLGDRRTITAIYQGGLTFNQELNFFFADHIKYSPSFDNISIFDIYEESVNQLKDEINTLLAFGNIDCQSEICDDDCVWPGDVDDNGIVDGKDVLQFSQFVSQQDSVGIPRDQVSHFWSPIASDDWGFEQNNINGKFADASGNGIINIDDTKIIELNFGKTNQRYVDACEEVNEIKEYNLNLTSEVTEMTWPNQNLVDNAFNLRISFSSETQVPKKIRGISFRIELDTHMIYPILGDTYKVLSSQIDYAHFEVDEILQDNDLGSVNLFGKSLMVISNMDQTELEKDIFHVGGFFSLRNQASTTNLNGIDTITFKIYDACAITTEGEIIELGVFHQDIIVNNLPVDMTSFADELLDGNSFKAYPNPFSNQIELDMKVPTSGVVSIYFVDGQLIFKRDFYAESKLTLNLDRYKSGMYILEVKDASGRLFSQKIVKI